MLQTGILLFTGVVFFLFGLFGFFSPHGLAEAVGLTINTGDAQADIAATYGGLAIAIGAFFVRSAFKAEHTSAALLAVVAVAGGLGVARLIYVPILGGDVTSFTYGAIAFELVTATIAWVAYTRLDRVE